MGVGSERFGLSIYGLPGGQGFGAWDLWYTKNAFWIWGGSRNCELLGTLGIHIGWTPHHVIVAIKENKDYIRVLLYSYYTTITGWGSS